MGNSDPLVETLKAFGYSIVRLPKADIRPLQLLVKQGNNLERLGELTTLMVVGNNIPLPEISRDVVAANIVGERSGNMKIGVGLSLLGNIIAAMGGSKIGLDVKYQQAKSASFEFHDVLEDRVEVAKLDQYLTDADVSPFSRHVSTLLEADDIFVTTAVIKSKIFTLEARNSEDTELELNASDIQQVVGGNVKVGFHNSVASKINYEGAIPLVFGFQAVRLYYDEGRYTAFKPLNAGEIAMRNLQKTTSDGTELFMSESPFVRLAGD